MYQILCDGHILHDPRDEDLVVKDKKCKIGSNICGEASFSIYANHPHYDKLKRLRSVFEIKQDNETIFRGRMTDDSRDFNNMMAVDLEGAMSYLNDSVIPPYTADDFSDASSGDNVVERFFRWIIDRHNSQVQPFQQFKVGKVTVTDPNNYLPRSSSNYQKTWATVKEKLFESSLGGYLCIRYEEDGNYLDYLVDYLDDEGEKDINSQEVRFGENLLDFQCDSDGTETYSAIIPLAKIGGSENLSTINPAINPPPDGNITDDIVKKGDALYSIKAVEEYGWICAPIEETTFEGFMSTAQLIEKGVEWLKSKGYRYTETTTLTAMDMHLADSEIEAFRVYKYVQASSRQHNKTGVFPLSVLDIDMDNVQNTKITIGETKRTLTDKTTATANKITVVEETVNANQENTDQNLAELEALLAEEISKTEEAIASLKVENGEILAKVENTEGYLAEFQIDLDGIKASVSTNTDDIAQLTIDINSIKASVSNGVTSAELALTIGEDGIARISASADAIHFDSGEITISSDNFKLDSDGIITCSGGTFEGSFSCSYGGSTITMANASITLSGLSCSAEVSPWGLDVGGTSYGDSRITHNGWQTIGFNSDGGTLYGTWYGSVSEATTSDVNKKHEIEGLTAAYSALFDVLTPRLYKYNDGTSNRVHVGFIAQEVEAAINAAGLTTQDFAGFVRTQRRINKETDQLEEVCCLRYEEFIALCVNEIQALKKKVGEIEHG